MLRSWRRVTLVALTGGAAIAAQLVAVTAAQAAAPAITIAAASKIGPVTGYVVVEYRGGKFASAKIHGTITGATAGEIATLYAQPFPYAKAPAPVRSATISTAGPAAYSFTVTPTLATRYQVKLSVRKSAPSPLATSRVQTVYVTEGATFTGSGLCAQPGPPTAPVCRVTYRVFLVVPSSALRVEMSKRLYTYFGLRFGPPAGPTPPSPVWLYLNSGHPSLAGAQRISAHEFERTLTFSFTIGTGNHSWSWTWLVCLKDTLPQDGLGLPGHHGCGSSRIRPTVTYLG